MGKRTVTIKAKSSWKKIKAPSGGANDDFLDGFIGLEELTDYKLVKHHVKRNDDIPRNLRVQTFGRSQQLQSKTSEKKRPISQSGNELSEPEVKKPKLANKKTTEPSTTESEGPSRLPKTVPKKPRSKNLAKTGSLKRTYDKCDFQPSVTSDTGSNAKLEETLQGWKDLYVPELVLQALADLGFTAPTSIQALTLPSAIRDKKDIVGAAETGSGKTLAFGIPILHHILRDKANENSLTSEDIGSVGNEVLPNKDDQTGTMMNTKLRSLILTPTRELAVQIKNHLVAVAKYTGIKIAVVVGGFAPEKQYRILKKQPDIVIATPGRLWELFQEGEPHLSRLEDIQYLVIDEADRMLEKGHFEELSKILERLKSNEEAKAIRQTYVFSATLTLIHQLPKRILEKKKKKKINVDQKTKLDNLLRSIGVREKPKLVDITRNLGTAETLTEARINCELAEKDIYLYYFLTQYPGRTLVFCNSIDCVRRLVNIFSFFQHHSVWPLHASMHQKQRLKNLERFTENERACLLATDVAARGLDIPNVEHVIHYQVPRTSEAYVHRSGRTARATKEGLSIMLIEPNEATFYGKICKTLNRDKELPIFPVDTSVLRELKSHMEVARQLDKLEHSVRKMSTQNNWFQKAAQEMDIEIDDQNLLNDLGEEYEQAKIRRKIKALQSQLTHMVKRGPIISAKSNVSLRYPATGVDLPALIEPQTKATAIAVMKKDKLAQEQLLKVYQSSKRAKMKRKKKQKKRSK